MRAKILFFLLMLCAASCTAAPAAPQGSSTAIEGRTEGFIKITVFNGKDLEDAGASKGKFRLESDISRGCYGAVFFTKTGFYPKTVLFKAGGAPAQAGDIRLESIEEDGKGVLTGVVFTPAEGGKLEERNGICRVYKSEDVRISGAFGAINVKTDGSGVYTAPLPEGEYAVDAGGKAAGRALVRKGETVIINMEKGVLLVD